MTSGRRNKHYFAFADELVCPYCGKHFVPRFRHQPTCGHYTCRRRAIRDGARPVRVRRATRRPTKQHAQYLLTMELGL